MSGHTPGPWILMDGRTFDTQSGKFFLSYGSVPGTGEWLFKSPTELDRNAVLIAAAPDLYCSLKELLDICRSKCSPLDEQLLPNKTNEQAMIDACYVLDRVRKI